MTKKDKRRVALYSVGIVIGLLLLPWAAQVANAKPHMLSWTWPTTDCDNVPLFGADLIQSELIFDTVPMPMPSDADGPCAPTADPGPPAGATVVPIPLTDIVVTLNLQPGQTYYARIRVSAYVNGNWSSWSDETQFTVPYGRPNKIRFSSGLIQYEYYEYGMTKLVLSKS